MQRRGCGLLLSTLDWALIETWKDAGVPLEAVLRGIDAAFDSYDQHPSKTKKINSLAYCSQAVLTAAEDMKEAAVGANTQTAGERTAKQGFEPNSVAAFLRRSAETMDKAQAPPGSSEFISETARTLRQLGDEIANKSRRLEDLERHLTVLEEKLFAMLLTSTPDAEIVTVRAAADRDLAPYRRKMSAPQIEQLHKQYVQKSLLERYKLPRLSLFYM